MSKQINFNDLQTAREEAILTDRSALGVLRFSGESRLDLLHRMSTQDVARLQPGEGAATILTTDIGRIIDRLILYAGSQAVYALTGENNADNIARYLMRFVFFNDDFHVEDLSGDTAVLALYGPKAQEKLQTAGFTDTNFPLHHWREQKIDDIDIWLARTDPLNGDGYFVMCHEADRETVWQRLLGSGITAVSEPAFEYIRIAAGLPRFGYEITGDYIPLETGLWADVSFNKGCYTGQEIIARMESRGKLAKQLVRLRTDGPLAAGDAITAEGKNAGIITSAAEGPDGFVALGYVKTAVLGNKSELMVGDTAVRVKT